VVRKILQDCYQDCEYAKGRDDEACSRKRKPKDRQDSNLSPTLYFVHNSATREVFPYRRQ
jgi:hypothetical protein